MSGSGGIRQLLQPGSQGDFSEEVTWSGSLRDERQPTMQRSGEEDFEQETKQNIKLQKPRLRKEQARKEKSD